jgi:arsenate reductase-like glutaredoxin family protein
LVHHLASELGQRLHVPNTEVYYKVRSIDKAELREFGKDKHMRADGLIETKGTQLKIPERDKLKQVGEFDPTYLHLESNQAAA